MSAATAIRPAWQGPRCTPECVRCASCSGSTQAKPANRGCPPMTVRVIASRDSVPALTFVAALTAAGWAIPWT
jgi:hypothetical protein